MRLLALLATLVLVPALADANNWLTYVDETTSRLVAAGSVGVSDVDEKDYAWGDLDQDGDVDLVIVRKLPWMAPGGRRNVVLMNEGVAEGHAINGVLVDRTATVAAAGPAGSQGFLDLTIDRDVQLVDVNGDGWLDMVTATALSQGQPKTISHPRVYRNLGAPSGTWLGFVYEEPRTPTMPSTPNFCGLAHGDVTGDGFPDLYFSEYETALEDRLWINDGTGTFTDESTIRMTYQMRESEFGVFAVNGDVNGDGLNDIVKCRSNGAPYRVSVAYNDPLNQGFFSDFQVVYSGSPYYVELGDLNNDGLLDMYINDDGLDRSLTNLGNGPTGMATFSHFTLPPSSNEFAGRAILEDMNNDGFLDVLQADAAINGFGCLRHLRFWCNQGNVPNVSFVEESGGIPVTQRQGTWDVGAFDLNGDGWKDMVIGTCTGTRIWMAVPPGNVDIVVQNPTEYVAPMTTTDVDVEVVPFGLATIVLADVQIHTRIDGGAFTAAVMTSLGGNSFRGALPAGSCLQQSDYYVSVTTAEGQTFLSPAGAPTALHSAVAATGLQTVLAEDGSNDVAAWTITNTSISGGGWEAAVPVGTSASGAPAAPFADASGVAGGAAFITENGNPGGSAGTADVDGGPTCLVSPVFDLGGSNGIVTYQRWLTSTLGSADSLIVSISNDDGSNWLPVATVSEASPTWLLSSFRVSDHIMPSSQMRLRFCIADQPNDSITEAGIDDFHVQRFACSVFVRGDCNDDGATNIADAVNLLGYLFPGSGGGVVLGCFDACDHNDDGSLDISDPIAVLGFLFGASGGLPAPTVACGPDPSGDLLDCAGQASCP
ncbi:MAG: FG-GAP-like repeat-containing protein [Planctomycetota bacterium]